MKIVPISTDPSGFPLDPAPPPTPVDVGETRSILCELQAGPMIVTKLRMTQRARWRIEEATVDGRPVDVDDEDGRAVGRVLFVRFTNVGDAPAHFHATWELEDAQ